MLNDFTDKNLAVVAGSILSYVANDSFTGWSGVGKAWLVGSGTGMGYFVASTAVSLASLLLATQIRSKGIFEVGYIASILCGIAGGYAGYSYSNEWLTPARNNINSPAETIVTNPKLSWVPDTNIMTLKA